MLDLILLLVKRTLKSDLIKLVNVNIEIASHH